MEDPAAKLEQDSKVFFAEKFQSYMLRVCPISRAGTRNVYTALIHLKDSKLPCMEILATLKEVPPNSSEDNSSELIKRVLKCQTKVDDDIQNDFLPDCSILMHPTLMATLKLKLGSRVLLEPANLLDVNIDQDIAIYCNNDPKVNF